jgi:sarcosine oxidase
MKLYDSIVIGLGASGSSALYHLARSGRKVLGLERWTIPHKFGSSHGDSRIIRQAYFEGEYYVPFAKEAYTLWDDLERETKTQLFKKTRCLNISTLSDNLVGRCREVSDLHKLKYSLLTNEQVNTLYPFFSIPNQFHCLEEENAGILFPEICNLAHLELAKKYHAQINFNNEVIKISQHPNSHYEVITNQGIFHTDSIVISAGSGLINLLENFNIKIPFSIDLNYVYYFKMRKTFGEFPIYLISYDPENEFYGFPDLQNGNGFKVSLYKQHLQFNSEVQVNREHEISKIKNQINDLCMKFIRDFDGFEGKNVYDVKHLTCLYTSTPDKDFIIDYIPGHEKVVLISACSGHGFKFSSRIGEHGANLINKKEKAIERFKLGRLL